MDKGMDILGLGTDVGKDKDILDPGMDLDKDSQRRRNKPGRTIPDGRDRRRSQPSLYH